MTTSKSTGKLRPYRVDYFDARDMQGDKALVRFALVHAVTAEEARQRVLNPHCIAIRAYRFYKKLPKEPGLVSIKRLFFGAKLDKAMERIKMRLPVSGPGSPATKAVMKDFAGMMSHDKHERMMDTFVPDEAMTPGVALIIQAETPAAPPDRTLSMMEYAENPPSNKFAPWPTTATPPPAPVVCPTCGIGTDTDGDGNRPVCAAPAYKQPLTRNSYVPLYWALGIVVVLIGASLAYLYFIKYIGN